MSKPLTDLVVPYGRVVLLSLFILGSGCTKVIDADELSSRTCGEGEKVCADETGRLTCVATNLPEHGCASASCSPCYFQNATGSKCSNGLCSPTACRKGFLKGPGASDNCSVDIHHDPLNCGNLGTRCRPGEVCIRGRCTGSNSSDGGS